MGIPIAIAATVMATAVSSYGAIESSHASAAAANYQAQVQANNARVAAQNQMYTVTASQDKAAAESLQGGQQVAAIKAAEASQGVDVNSGSALDTQISQKLVNQQNVATTLSQGQWSGYGYQVAAQGDQAQSALSSQSASQYGTAGILGATGSLLSGAASTAGLAALNAAPNVTGTTTGRYPGPI